MWRHEGFNAAEIAERVIGSREHPEAAMLLCLVEAGADAQFNAMLDYLEAQWNREDRLLIIDKWLKERK